MGTTGVLHELRNKIIGFLFTIRSIYNHALYCWEGLLISVKNDTIALFFDISKNGFSHFFVSPAFVCCRFISLSFVPCLGRLQGWADYLSGQWVLARPGLI